MGLGIVASCFTIFKFSSVIPYRSNSKKELQKNKETPQNKIEWEKASKFKVTELTKDFPVINNTEESVKVKITNIAKEIDNTALDTMLHDTLDSLNDKLIMRKIKKQEKKKKREEEKKELRAKQLEEEKSWVTNSNNNQSESEISEKKRVRKEKEKYEEESKTRRSVERNTDINRDVEQSMKKTNNDRTNRKDDEKLIILRGIRKIPTLIKEKRYGVYGKRDKDKEEKSTMILIEDFDCFKNLFLEYFWNNESENYNENLFKHYIACSNTETNYICVLSANSFNFEAKDVALSDTISWLLENEAIKFMLPKVEKICKEKSFSPLLEYIEEFNRKVKNSNI